MDSGRAVPTLKPGLRETVAAKFLKVAVLRAACVPVARLGASPCASLGSAALSDFMLVRRAFFLAAERAGRSIAATIAMRATTTSNSISVKAGREGSFISHLVGLGYHDSIILSIADATALFRGKWPNTTPRGKQSA